jgi:hypothetical protein
MESVGPRVFSTAPAGCVPRGPVRRSDDAAGMARVGAPAEARGIRPVVRVSRPSDPVAREGCGRLRRCLRLQHDRPDTGLHSGPGVSGRTLHRPRRDRVGAEARPRRRARRLPRQRSGRSVPSTGSPQGSLSRSALGRRRWPCTSSSHGSASSMTNASSLTIMHAAFSSVNLELNWKPSFEKSPSTYSGLGRLRFDQRGAAGRPVRILVH